MKRNSTPPFYVHTKCWKAVLSFFSPHTTCQPLQFHADIFFAWTQRDGGIKDTEKPFRNHSSLERSTNQRHQRVEAKKAEATAEEDNCSYNLLDLRERTLACCASGTQHTFQLRVLALTLRSHWTVFAVMKILPFFLQCNVSTATWLIPTCSTKINPVHNLNANWFFNMQSCARPEFIMSLRETINTHNRVWDQISGLKSDKTHFSHLSWYKLCINVLILHYTSNNSVAQLSS